MAIRRSLNAPLASPRDVLRHGARGEHVYRKLRDAIQSGALKPGQRIMEIEVADWLRVSRTPVRDAIRRLESEGMMQHAPRNGLMVARLDRQAVMELYVMRETLEGTAAQLCARHASDMEILDLLDLIEREQALQGDYDALARHNRRFHEAVHRGAHNRYLEKSLVTVSDSMGLLGESQMRLPHRAQEALAEHTEMARAIQRRDTDAAADVARKHVRAAQRERLKRLFPDTGR
ncbi:MAG TPA: GntR family transcriptional regulator [Burkholderiales bacterium]|nr:GntR family transcriptional regulator [Burkholderiales bacterium]